MREKYLSESINEVIRYKYNFSFKYANYVEAYCIFKKCVTVLSDLNLQLCFYYISATVPLRIHRCLSYQVIFIE